MTVTVKPKPGAPIKPGVPAAAKPVQLIAPVKAAPPLAAPAKKLTAKTAEATILKTMPDKTQTEEKEQVGPVMVAEQHATVGLSMSFTKQIVQYEPFKAQVSLFVPCANDPVSIEQAYEFAKEWVDGKINAISEEVQGMIDA